ncbi:MAG: prepilin-type N-terminal cleavage/methylation domain-containing protein [Sedimentisphaerales bacterium]|nr:prepilin-type N-terminal cleavage/methylation domain-containing protein [Sedimentisphaerales bacterium]
MTRAIQIRDSESEIRSWPAPGFTLVEMVVSLGIASVLMLSVGGAMLLAGRAVPDAKSPAGTIVNTSSVLEQILSELQYATTVNGRSATMIEFAVADRDGNDVEEVIRYEWSGTAGAPLTRQYNGKTPVTVLTDVRDFALTYDLKTISEEVPQGNESAETLLISWTQTLHSEDFPIKSSEWYGQYFFPALPADAVSWKVTRVKIYGRTDGAFVGESRVQLQTPTAGKRPSGTVLEEKTLMEAALLVAFGEAEFEFYGVSGRSPSQGLCLVVKWVYDSTACQLWGYDEGASTSDSFLIKSTDKGVTWSAPSGYGLKYRVYGTVTTSGTPQIQTTYYLERVNVQLRSGTDTQATLQGAVRLLDKPEVSG